jgi:hypothetical protein
MATARMGAGRLWRNFLLYTTKPSPIGFVLRHLAAGRDSPPAQPARGARLRPRADTDSRKHCHDTCCFNGAPAPLFLHSPTIPRPGAGTDGTRAQRRCDRDGALRPGCRAPPRRPSCCPAPRRPRAKRRTRRCTARRCTGSPGGRPAPAGSRAWRGARGAPGPATAERRGRAVSAQTGELFEGRAGGAAWRTGAQAQARAARRRGGERSHVLSDGGRVRLRGAELREVRVDRATGRRGGGARGGGAHRAGRADEAGRHGHHDGLSGHLRGVRRYVSRQTTAPLTLCRDRSS